MLDVLSISKHVLLLRDTIKGGKRCYNHRCEHLPKHNILKFQTHEILFKK